MEFNHIPVLLDECVEGLDIKQDGTYVDATVGGAGHSKQIATRLGKNGTLVCIDRDPVAIEVAKERLKDAKCKTIFVCNNFANYASILQNLGITCVDGILADLGVSSHQIDEPQRGFSYSHNGPLDMRMNQQSGLSAKDVVNNYAEKDLVKILFEFGEESFAKKIARAICEARKLKPIETTQELKEIVEKSLPKKAFVGGGSVAKKTFQALRIETNAELDSLKNALQDMINSLSKGGRICIISFHSLEDRIVKNCFNLCASNCICPKELPICVCHHKATIKLVCKKPITATVAELEKNPRSSSAKLRIAQKL